MMKKLPLNNELIEERLSFIEQSCISLDRFSSSLLKEFQNNYDNYRIAFYDLYKALESVLDIGAHILSRIPGTKAKSYKEIALLLAERKILPEKFAMEKLVKMAGYRNRMTHFYYRISPEKILKIIKIHLNDFTKFSTYIKKILINPKRYGFPEQ
jgi:uncharacterized protein YutE (UPF0331/DUF86 family)